MVRGVWAQDEVPAGFRPGAVAVEHGPVAVPGGVRQVRAPQALVVSSVSGERAWSDLNYHSGIMLIIKQSSRVGWGRSATMRSKIGAVLVAALLVAGAAVPAFADDHLLSGAEADAYCWADDGNGNADVGVPAMDAGNVVTAKWNTPTHPDVWSCSVGHLVVHPVGRPSRGAGTQGDADAVPQVPAVDATSQPIVAGGYSPVAPSADLSEGQSAIIWVTCWTDSYAKYIGGERVC